MARMLPRGLADRRRQILPLDAAAKESEILSPSGKPNCGLRTVEKASASGLEPGFRDADEFVGGAVIEEKAVFLLHHPFNKNYVRDLANFLPFFFGGEDGSVGAGEELAGIVTVEDGNRGAIDELIVGAVVN